ncbi:MAG TPA: hypothetical protein PKD83_08680 [Ignavibacteria bacterium]|nr:hypothetical protein [Ignavibacteria bacterium]
MRINKLLSSSYKKLILLISIFISANNISLAQDSSKTDCLDPMYQYDIKDMLSSLFGSKGKLLDTLKVNPNDKVSLSILPGISYNPATDVIFGVSASLSWYMGNKKTTNNSSIASSISYSTRKQLKLSVQSNIYTKNNKWVLQGDWRFWKFVQNTYGLGTGTPESNSQNMDFNFIRFNENVLAKISNNFYAGLGYSLQYYGKIQTVNAETDSLIYPSFNSTYSQVNNIDSVSYLVSGLSATASYDSRDNTINPYKGVYIQLAYANYTKNLGSTTNSNIIDGQIRAYKSLDKCDRYIMAFWLMGATVVNGTLPYMILPATGWDKYNASGRGYIQGRYRGDDFLYFEFENRFTFTKNRFFGMVAFVNAETFASPQTGVRMFQYIAPAGGIGVRFLFDKASRTNLGVDFGMGIDGSKGVYLTLGEFF